MRIYIHVNENRGFFGTGYECTALSNLSKTEKKELERLIDKGKHFIHENPKSKATDVVNYLKGGESKGSLFNYFEVTIPKLSDGNSRPYKSTLNALRDYSEDIDISEIDYSFIKGFDEFLDKKGMSINGKSVYLRTFRALHNRAAKEFDIESYPWRKISISTERVIPRRIRIEDLKKIWNAEGKERDLFMLSFFLCGMNMVDLCFNEWKIKDGRFEVKRKKVTRGSAFVSIKIEPEMNRLIEELPKYENYSSYKTFLKRHNHRLKQLGERLNIDEPLTSYVARYSWANFAKELGYSQDIIGEMMGHSKKGVTSLYLLESDFNLRDTINRKIIESIIV